MSLLIMVPTRDRPKQLADLVRSVMQTAPDATVAAYVDVDQRMLYEWVEHESAPKCLKVTFGQRLGPVAAINHLASEHRGYGAYGFFCDDCRVTIPGWDAFVLRELDEFPKRLGVVAGAHATADVDFPFVSAEWLDLFGWYAQPGLYHWAYPSVIAALGVAIGCVKQAEPGEFWFDHDVLAPKNRDKYPSDMVMLYDYFSMRFAADVEKLRKALR